MGPWGAIIMSVFAAILGAVGIASKTDGFGWAILLPLAISAVLTWWAIVRLGSERADETTADKRVGRIVMWASVGEGVGIFVLANVFANVGLAARLVPGIAAIVGLHFVPMAYAIPFPRFYALAAALLVVAAAGFTVGVGEAALVGGVGAAVGLWAASALALGRAAKIG